MQQTLVLVKPDGVKKNVIGEIIAPLHAKSKISLKLKKFINLKFSGRMVTK